MPEKLQNKWVFGWHKEVLFLGRDEQHVQEAYQHHHSHHLCDTLVQNGQLKSEGIAKSKFSQM